MKKGFKVLLIIAVCLVIVGTIMAVVSVFFIKDLDFDAYSSAVSDKGNNFIHHILNEKVHVNIDRSGITVTSGDEDDDGLVFGQGQSNISENGSYSIDEQSVRKLNIDWVAGDIEIAADNNIDSIIFSESFSGFTKPLSYKLIGNTLKISFTDNDSLININGSKDLMIRVPSSCAENISEMEINSVSSDCKISGLSVDELNFNSVSGELDFSGSLRDAEANSVSGNVNITSSICPENIEVETTSGNVALTLPENGSFTVEYDTVSGSISADLPLTVHNEKYICGSGINDFEINTISGNLSINTK